MLTSTQLQAIKQLQKKCEQQDKQHLKLNWDMLQQRKLENMDYFIWQDGELIAFLGLYDFGQTVEVCGMVAPSERRKGHFTLLWAKARQTIQRMQFQKVLLNAPALSESAKSWLTTVPCEYSFSEYQMRWERIAIEKSTEDMLRESTNSDEAFEIDLDILAFQLSKEDATELYNRVKSRPLEKRYIILDANQRIGKIRVNIENGIAYIYGFSILPKYQGKGFGGKALRNIVYSLSESTNSILLDVEIQNENALQLYTNVGFKVEQRQDYYLFPNFG